MVSTTASESGATHFDAVDGVHDCMFRYAGLEEVRTGKLDWVEGRTRAPASILTWKRWKHFSQKEKKKKKRTARPAFGGSDS